MLQELGDESENQGLKMYLSVEDKSDGGSQFINIHCMSATLKSRTLETTSICDRDAAP